MTGTPWPGDKVWPGATVVILATGQSLSSSQIWNVYRAKRDRDWKVLAINDAVFLAWWADAVFVPDERWWKKWNWLPGYQGLRLSASNHAKSFPHNIWTLENTGREGFDPDPKNLRTGKNSGYMTIHFALHAGAKRILLLGYDMHGEHYFGKHEDWNQKPGLYDQWLPNFKALTYAAHERGVEILNCTPGSALKAFPAVKFGKVV